MLTEETQMIALFGNMSDFLQGQITSPSLDTYLEKVTEHDDKESFAPSAWLYLLERLIIITADTRPEVRNSAVHVALRVFNACELSAASWDTCFRLVLVEMIQHNIERHKAVSSDNSKSSRDMLNAWNESSRLLINGFSDLFASNIQPLLQSSRWSGLWELIMEQFQAYLNLHAPFLHGIIYSALSKILNEYPQSDSESRVEDLDVVLNLWLNNSPADMSTTGQDLSTSPLDSYVKTFQQLYRLYHIRMLTGVLETCTINLLQCVETSSGAAYDSDVDRMTDLQSNVLSCFKDIDLRCRAAQSLIVTSLSAAIAFPFRQATGDGARKQLTFIAFSKSAMDLLVLITSEERRQGQENLTNKALLGALESLKTPIEMKYSWRLQGKQPYLWQKATTTALAVLRQRLHHACQASKEGDEIELIWLAVVRIASAIAHADCTSSTELEAILADEQFDIGALTTLRQLIVPSLGSASVPDTTRRLYTSNLFLTSLVHKTEPGEYPSPPAEPLQKLYTVRFGSTNKHPPTVRTKMAYFCFSELLALTASTAPTDNESSNDGPESSERISLAQAAAPYLILRAALPIKSYIADQPLRGRAPQPFSQRAELLFTLRQMRALRSEKGAIPEAEGASTEKKRHLVRLFPLVTRAMEVCGGRKGLARDEKLLAEMAGWISDVGGEFGI